MHRKNGPVIESVESVLRPKGSPCREKFVKEIGYKQGVKECGSYG